MTRASLLLLLSLIALGGSMLAASQTARATKPPPKTVVARAKADWLRTVRASAKTGDRAARFPSPSRAVLIRRLRQSQRRYGFQIVGVKMFHPLGAAPVVVIRSDQKLAIAHATPAIVARFDPRHVTKQNSSGYAYEAYFFEARDAHGVPYLATFNHWRPPHVGGGQWAKNESLYPFPHG
jgi:hypothetical protein